MAVHWSQKTKCLRISVCLFSWRSQKIFLEDFEDRARVKFSVKYSVEYRYVDLGATVKGVPQESSRQSFLDPFYFNQTVNDFLKYFNFSFFRLRKVIT